MIQTPLSPPTRLPPSPGLLHSWQRLHRLLTPLDKEACTPADCVGLSVYHYSVYKAFGHAPDAALAQHLFQRLLPLVQPPPSGWASGQLDQLCLVAWLHAHLAAEGKSNPQATALLAGVDLALGQEVRHLRQQATPGNEHDFFRVVRYFGLRQLPGAGPYLQELLAAPLPLAGTAGPQSNGPATQLGLGLTDGLAAHLLLLARLSQRGVPGLALSQSVRQGVQRLLALRRDVDFTEQHYAVFPYQVHNVSGLTSFSPELSWRRGDLGQALLLYEAQALLQDSELTRIGELVGLNTLLRTTEPTTQVTNSLLYRGAAGVAHLYYKLYHASGQHPAYQRGYLFWLDQTQTWLHHELATGFYQNRESELLHGLVGVGLVLLSALAGRPLDWDTAVL